MELNNDTGESAPRDPKLAGAQYNERKVCQPPPGTTRTDAQLAPVWDNVDSEVALRRGIGYLHARDNFQGESFPATSCKLVDRQARNPSPHATAERGFWSDDDLEKTIEATRPDMESEQLDRSDSQRPSAQFPPADAVISTEMRLTTRELYPERTAGPYSPDSHCQTGLLEGRSAIIGAQVRGALTGVDTTDQLNDYDERNAYKRNDVGLAGFGFDEMRTVTRNDIFATRDQRQHEARNAADDVTSTPYRHAEKRERDRHDGYATGYLIDERDERRCSDQPTHAHRQSDWTGCPQQNAMCNSLKATAASNAYAVDARQRTGFDNTLDATRRVMTTCVIDADMDDYQFGTACAIVYEPATDCENRLHRRCASDTSILNDSDTDDVGLKRQFTPTERHSLDGRPRHGRSSLPSQAKPLRPMLVYLDPQTGLLSPMRHDCRMTLNNYEKVIDTQANATRLKRANRVAKRLSFFDDRKPGLLGIAPIDVELPHEPCPSVSTDLLARTSTTSTSTLLETRTPAL